jgi:hypothetical protein
MKFFLLFTMFLSTPSVFAAFNEKLTITQVKDDGSQFIYLKKEGEPPEHGITIKDPQTKVKLYEAIIVRCRDTKCLARVVNNFSGIKLRKDEEYMYSHNETPIKLPETDSPVVKPEPLPEPKPEPIPEVKPEVKPEPIPEPKPVPVPVVPKPKPKPKPAPVVKKAEPKIPSKLDKAFYVSYGSPIGPGFKLGYFKQQDLMWYGINYAKISSTTNNVSIDGHLLSGVVTYTIFKVTPAIDFNIVGELGLAKATLDFKGVDVDGPVKDETTYFLGGAGEGRINFDQLSLSVKMGLSKAGFAASYDGEFSKFNNPYGAILGFLEIGAYYRF